MTETRLRVFASAPARTRLAAATWARDWGGALTMLACAGAAALAAAASIPHFPDPLAGAGSRWVGWIVQLAIALLAWRASHHPELAAGARHAWWRVGTAFLMVGAADIAWRLLGQPAVSWVDVPRLAFYPLMLWALLGLPTTRSGERERLQFALDAGAVVVSGAMVLWYFILEPSLESMRAGVSMPSRVLVRAAYPLGDLLLLIGALAVVLRRPAAGSRAALRFLTAGIVLYLIADVSFAYVTVGGRYRPSDLVELAWIAGSCLVLVGAQLQWMRGGGGPDAEPAAPERTRGFSLVPYTAFALAYALLLLAARSLWAEPIGGLVIGAVGLTALVVMRQIAAMRENARLQREQASRESEARFEARFRALVQSSSDVILILAPDSTIQYVSAAAERVFGYEPDSLTGRRLAELIHPDDSSSALSGFAETVRARGELRSIYCRVRRADGTWRHVESIGTNYLHDPSIRGVVLNARDVSERAALEAELAHQAFHDPLTGLANRTLFRDRVEHAIAREGRRREGVTVLFLDLDDFKRVNDSLGHREGDRLLVKAAERLLNATRGCDTVARLGGDEFAVLLENVGSERHALVVAERIIAALGTPIALEGAEVQVGCSIGIARARVEDEAEELLRNADVAMYRAKQRGKGCYEVFAPEMHSAALDRLALEADLRQALEREELTVVYQPIVDLSTGEVVALESLVRWCHPRRGPIPPAGFIPLAEATGLIVPLGRWVLGAACREAAMWRDGEGSGGEGGAGKGHGGALISVNISGRQLQSADLVEDVRAALDASGLPAHRLVLEITESAIMDDLEAALARLHALKALGVRLAIDDFGTGYSSLSYLKRFPVDILKIDKSFVDGIGRGGSDAALARTIIALGEQLSLRCVAEGIEDHDQHRHLRAIGCGFGQGYLFSRPLAPVALAGYLAEHAGAAAAPVTGD